MFKRPVMPDVPGNTPAPNAQGDMLYSANGTTWTQLAIGSAGEVLTVNAGGTAPDWLPNDAISPTIFSAANQLITSSGNDTPALLAAPATDEVLTESAGSLDWRKLVNANIDAAAAIAYSKLNLATSIVNNDVAAAAAIAISKLADVGSGNVLTSAGSGNVAVKPPGFVYNRTSKTTDATITATTEGTADTVVAASATVAPGAGVVLEIDFYAPSVVPGANTEIIGVLLRDSTVVGTVSLGFAAAQRGAPFARFYDTPGAGSIQYTMKAYVVVGAASSTITGGAGGSGNRVPMQLTIKRSA